MNTFLAALSHIGIGALQTAAAVPFFDPHGSAGALGNAGVQIGVQVALMALQAAAASKNSNTDPKGQKLIQVSPGQYMSSTK